MSMEQVVRFRVGELLVVWQYATGHRKLVSLVEAEPTRARIEWGGWDGRRDAWVSYDRLKRRGDGGPLDFATAVERAGVLQEKGLGLS